LDNGGQGGQGGFNKGGRSSQGGNNFQNNDRNGGNRRSGNSPGGRNGSRGQQVVIDLPPREQVSGSLKKAENAFKPSAKTDGAPKDILKEIKTCLNKLTLEKFDQLSSRIQRLLESDLSRVPELVRQIFEKAIDEEFFSMIYAKLCSSIALAKTETGEEMIPKFRKMLLDCCQKEFEKATAADSLAATDKMEEDALKLKVGADSADSACPPTPSLYYNAQGKHFEGNPFAIPMHDVCCSSARD
jgi:translation initiation factor 4G